MKSLVLGSARSFNRNVLFPFYQFDDGFDDVTVPVFPPIIYTFTIYISQI